MNSTKKLLLFLALTGFGKAHGMYKTTSPKLMKTAGTEGAKKFWSSGAKTYAKKGFEHAYKAYRIMEHPFYVKFFEPIYVGNKSDVWGKQLINLYQDPSDNFVNFYLMQKAHSKFHQKFYQTWKDQLTPEEQFQHYHAIKSYENSHENYLENPTDKNALAELMHQTNRISQIMQDQFLEKEKALTSDTRSSTFEK